MSRYKTDPLVMGRVRNGYVSPVSEVYITDILGGFMIPDPTKTEEG